MTQAEQDKVSRITLYKLKDHIESLEDQIFPKYPAVVHVQATDNSFEHKLYFLRPPMDNPPKWYKIFKELELDLTSFGNASPKIRPAGFILLVNTESSTFACTGGLGYHALTKELGIEPRFGIEVAKKILAADQIKGLVQKETSGVVNHLDRVFRGNYNPKGDIDNLHRVLTNIRASFSKDTPNYELIGASIRAGDSLNVSGGKTFGDILDFISDVEEIQQDDSLIPLNIPELEYINTKFEGPLVDTLWQKLAIDILEYHPDKIESPYSLFLDNVDIGFLPDVTEEYAVIYSRERHLCQDYTQVLSKVAELLTTLPEDDRTAELKRISLQFKLDGEEEFTPSKKIVHFICGDVVLNDEIYFLNNERWYRANEDFIDQVNKEINELQCGAPESYDLLAWHHAEERLYNNAHSDTHVVLDRRCVRITQESGPIEFCDLMQIGDYGVRLLHVKKACGAELRALFAQGYVSAELYASDSEFKEKVHTAQLDDAKNLSQEDKAYLANLAKLAKHKITIVYAIYDDKPAHPVEVHDETPNMSQLFSGTLTLFAKIDLLSRASALRASGYNVALTRIKPYPER